MKGFRFILVILLVGFLVVSCSSGGSTDGGDSSGGGAAGDPFIPGAGSTGTIELALNTDRVAVGEIEGYRVIVKDRDGRASANVAISMDSEQGVAIIEPSTGKEGTDSAGQISGKFGCARPGSYRIAARLPVGANKRDIQTVICEGSIPSGFDGFPGAAGGGLGGGSVGDDSGGPGGTDPNGVEISVVQLQTVGGSTSQIDTTQSVCTPDDPTTPVSELELEPFTDDFLVITVRNNTNSIVSFDSLQYTIQGRTSQVLNFVGESKVDANGGTAQLTVLAFRSTSGGEKVVANSSSSGLSEGFSNLTLTIQGATSTGRAVSITKSQVFSVNRFNNC